MADGVKLTDLQKDALKEMGSIAAAHSATALSSLVDRKVLITVPQVHVMPVEQIPEIMGGLEALVAAVHIKIWGELSGTLLFVWDWQGAFRIIEMMKGQERGTVKVLTEVEKETLRQTGNLLATSYLNALTRFVDFTVLSSPPNFVCDMVGAVLGSVVAEMGLRMKYGVIIDTSFVEESSSVGARLVFLPDSDSLKKILDRIGVK